MEWWRTVGIIRALAVCWAFASASTFAADWSLTVVSIEVHGTRVAQPTLQVTPPQSAESRDVPVKPGHRFGVGTVIAAPPRTTVVLISSKGNRIRLWPNSRIRVIAGSDVGEEFSQETGRSLFDVRRALNFFTVTHGRFQAIVKGTVYSVNVVPEKVITIDVKEGAVRIKREGKLEINEGNKEGTIIRTETIKAGESRTYRLNLNEYLARFKAYGDAEAYYRRNLAADRLSGDRDRISSGLNDMGIVLGTLGRYQEAIRFFEELRKIVNERHAGGVHADIAASLNNLGIAYRDLGGTDNLQQAIEYHKESLKIQRQLYPGGVHPDIAASLNNLGSAYADLGGTDNLQQAIAYHKESLEIQRQLHPDGVHADIATSLNNLGIAYLRLGGTDNLQRAIGYHEESLKIKRQLYPGGAHAGIATSLINLGIAYGDLGSTDNFQRAIGYYEELLTVLRRLSTSGAEVVMAETMGKLSYQRLFVGQYNEALLDARAALQIAPDRLWIRTIEGHALLLMGREVEAMAIYAQHRDEMINATQTFRAAVLDDFDALRKAGVNHPAMARVEALYAQPAATPDRKKP